jgi:hypothetical protein
VWLCSVTIDEQLPTMDLVHFLCRRNVPIAELRAISRRPKTRRSLFKRDPRFEFPDSFFEPLPKHVLDGFEGTS